MTEYKGSSWLTNKFFSYLQIAIFPKCVHRKPLKKVSLQLLSTTLPSYESFPRTHYRIPCTGVALVADLVMPSHEGHSLPVHGIHDQRFLCMVSNRRSSGNWLFYTGYQVSGGCRRCGTRCDWVSDSMRQEFLVVNSFSWLSYRQDVANLY